jgi:hypothetical protein
VVDDADAVADVEPDEVIAPGGSLAG